MSEQLPSPAELHAHQTERNIPFGTCLLQDAKKREALLLLTVMDQPKQPANLRGELFSKLDFEMKLKVHEKRSAETH